MILLLVTAQFCTYVYQSIIRSKSDLLGLITSLTRKCDIVVVAEPLNLIVVLHLPVIENFSQRT